ncbi:hypothetical protein [Streptomyces cavernae]|uniref:hypothetical protein n=1 Tax=Streptomyces cavernae TaxID=2259034 RepID=UPI00192E5637|nr:hypothetical protein [Streptomyces cavernae]
MSDSSTTETTADDSRAMVAQGADQGHGKHRGPNSARDEATAPSGRHRKPSVED